MRRERGRNKRKTEDNTDKKESKLSDEIKVEGEMERGRSQDERERRMMKRAERRRGQRDEEGRRDVKRIKTIKEKDEQILGMKVVGKICLQRRRRGKERIKRGGGKSRQKEEKRRE